MLCGTYRETCQRLGFLENDIRWNYTLEDAVVLSNAKQIRSLFSIILSTYFPSIPINLWNKYTSYQMRFRTSNADLQINEEIHNEALNLI